MSQLTSPNYWGYNLQQIFEADVKQILKKGHQSQPLCNQNTSPKSVEPSFSPSFCQVFLGSQPVQTGFPVPFHTTGQSEVQEAPPVVEKLPATWVCSDIPQHVGPNESTKPAAWIIFSIKLTNQTSHPEYPASRAGQGWTHAAKLPTQLSWYDRTIQTRSWLLVRSP